MQKNDHFKGWQKIEARYYMQIVNRLPAVIVRGRGTLVWDNNSNKYLDFTAGWAVLNLGHSHPVVTNAIVEQSKKIMQIYLVRLRYLDR